MNYSLPLSHEKVQTNKLQQNLKIINDIKQIYRHIRFTYFILEKTNYPF